jgi:hypothetical protein
VLVRGGVEDDLGPEALHHLVHAVLVAAVGEDRLANGEVAILDQLALDLEQVVLGVVDQHQQTRAHVRDLTAQLGADRAPGAGNDHRAVAQPGAHLLDLERDRLAAEHVLHAHFAQLLDQVHRAGDQLEHAGQRAHRDVAVATDTDDASAHDSRRGRDRDDDLVRLGVIEHARKLGGRAQHLEAVDAHAALARVVVYEPDRRLTQLRRALHLARDELTCFARSYDQDLAPLREHGAARRALDDAAHREPYAPDQRRGQEQVHRSHRARQVALGR